MAALGGSSSSSLLRVRSTTWPAGLLLLDAIAGIGGPEEIDCSLDDIGGVLIKSGSRLISLFTDVNRETSLISTNSSSPSLLLRPFEVRGGEGALPDVWDQAPFGSIMT